MFSEQQKFDGKLEMLKAFALEHRLDFTYDVENQTFVMNVVSDCSYYFSEGANWNFVTPEASKQIPKNNFPIWKPICTISLSTAINGCNFISLNYGGEGFEKHKYFIQYSFTHLGLKDIIFKNLDRFSHKCGKLHKPILKLLRDLQFYGEKYEWVKNYPVLQVHRRQVSNYTSLKGMKNGLGFGFLSTKEFLELDFNTVIKVKDYPDKRDIVTHIHKLNKKPVFGENTDEIRHSAKDRQSHMLDTITMLGELGLDKKIPKGKGAMYELHDELVRVQNQAKIDGKSTEKYVSEACEEILQRLVDSDVEFKRLLCERDLFEEGLRQNHCIGGDSYYQKLKSGQCAFFSIKSPEDNKWYSLEFDLGRQKILQFQGRYRKSPEEALYKICQPDWKKRDIRFSSPDYFRFFEDGELQVERLNHEILHLQGLQRTVREGIRRTVSINNIVMSGQSNNARLADGSQIAHQPDYTIRSARENTDPLGETLANCEHRISTER